MFGSDAVQGHDTSIVIKRELSRVSLGAQKMKIHLKAALAALAFAGATAAATTPASAQGFGLTFGPRGGISFSFNSGGYCDDFGCPDAFWNMPVYYGPVFWHGQWYDGPLYYREAFGRREFWIHGDWRFDEWRGPHPSWWREGRYGPPLGEDYYRSHGFHGRWDDRAIPAATIAVVTAHATMVRATMAPASRRVMIAAVIRAPSISAAGPMPVTTGAVVVRKLHRKLRRKPQRNLAAARNRLRVRLRPSRHRMSAGVMAMAIIHPAHRLQHLRLPRLPLRRPPRRPERRRPRTAIAIRTITSGAKQMPRTRKLVRDIFSCQQR